MLEKVMLSEEISNKDYRKKLDELTDKLILLQQRAKREDLGVILVFEGWGSAGKGSRISDLVVNLDPRLFDVYTTEDPIGYESRLPFMARFWSRIGSHGTMTIFDQAWYEAVTRIIMDRIVGETAFGKKVLRDRDSNLEELAFIEDSPQETDLVTSYSESIRSFESQLADDGYLIIKIFMHITQDEQRKRFVSLMLDPETSWRVEEEDIRQVQRYPTYYRVYDKLLDISNRTHAPWTLVSGHNKEIANLQIMETLVSKMEEALDKKSKKEAEFEETASPGNELNLDNLSKEERIASIGDASDISSHYKLVEVAKLKDVSHDFAIKDKSEYKEQLREAQERLSTLQKVLYRKKIPLVMVYEGWDAAGKGGNIKRLAAALDARSYVVHPIGVPTSEELSHPFLWRFWTKLPRTGHIAIFDRSWYGRVMVERVEHFAREEEWRRAFDEINDFEAELARWGAIIVKFWINVSSEEQLNRFKSRQKDPVKRWKITDEDWRNREKADLYEIAIDDMLRLTSTNFAPWHIIESDDKRYARVKAIRILNETIEKRLGYSSAH